MKVVALNILVLALCLTLGNAAVTKPRRSVVRSDVSLMQIMADTREVQARSPQLSIQCFNYYTPLLNEIAIQYEKNYEACYTKSAASQQEWNNTTATERSALNSLATSSCSAVASCYTLSDVQSAFECYQTVSNSNSKYFYTMSKTAEDNWVNAKEQLRLLEVEENRCLDVCDRTYVKSTADAYEELQSCFAGLTEVPQTTQAPGNTEGSENTEAPETPEQQTTESPENPETPEEENNENQEESNNEQGSE